MVEEKRRRLVYGRRHGHKLRGRQQLLMREALPRLRIECKREQNLDPRSLFDFSPQETWLEIGFGGGEHLAAQARAHPQTGFIGCEPFINGVAKLIAAIDDECLNNIRIYDDDARDMLESLADGSISRVFLLFPDPWHKKRHNKRRFVSPENLDQLARIMRPGAILRIASDIPDYIRWTMRHIRAHPDFNWLANSPDDWRIRPDDWPSTRYEAKAIREGRTPCYLSFTRK